jgi:osmotically-inducible protein OsmY
MKLDSDIHRDVLRELKWDPRVEETEVGVEVDKGIVTLTGTVSSYAKRVAAEEAAHRVQGVLDVANNIQVKQPGALRRSDTDLAQAVRSALEFHSEVPHERIRTTVSDGLVTLEGEVDAYHQREEAGSVVRYVYGVRDVLNRITVRPASVAAGSIQEEIEDVLERRAERLAKKIKVAVARGTVTLTGPVQSWEERRAIVAAARYTPGVTAVEDRLHIE